MRTPIVLLPLLLLLQLNLIFYCSVKVWFCSNKHQMCDAVTNSFSNFKSTIIFERFLTGTRKVNFHEFAICLFKIIHNTDDQSFFDTPCTCSCACTFSSNLGPSIAPSPRLRHHHHHHHRGKGRPHAGAPAPSKDPGCDQICVEPLMHLHLVHLVVVQNQGRTVVDINLVPLGEKFDNTTAILTYDRFKHKKVPLNMTLFGNYEVLYISYPGIPSSPPYLKGNGPTGSPHNLPITAELTRKNQKMNTRTIAIIALSAFVLLLVILGAISILIKWRKVGRPSSAVGPARESSLHKRSGIGSMLSSSIASSTSVALMSTMATSILSVKTFPRSELEKATNKFSSQRVLGEGGFGRVYHGIMEDGTEVAVKVLTRDNNQNGDREFIAEVEMLSRLHHRNLVKLIGICIEGHARSLVYELIRNGSVESHLHGVDKKKGPLDWDARMKIALGAARGLAYLHEDSNPRVIHRDFKASNVLLEDDFTPKVSDFGLAREATEGSHHISTRVMGTFGYVAPEYAMTGHLLVKSDVYSYGVVLLELLSGRKPVDMSHPQGQENLVTWARPLLTSREGLQQLVDPALAGTYDFDDMAKVAAIASMCVHPEVTHRPFMGEVVQALKLIYNDTDETGGDCHSQKDSSVPDSFKCDLAPSDSSWWNAGGLTPRLNYGLASSFITMEYSSGTLEDMENRPFSTSSLVGNEVSLPIRHGNRSGPLRTIRSKPSFYRVRGSMSEHGGLLGRRAWNDGFWV
ncbi:hypothetical protein M0R45_010484 [Rubus argutus]|uniref:Protein kinase domain-containing protein n=1 Tax=Rubus argutus TaxID=59490 RepID=A0AAW1Y7J3_RUBAR